jgi:hypothetical protein
MHYDRFASFEKNNEVTVPMKSLSFLQADEHLLWSDSPKFKYIREPLQPIDIILLVPLSLVFALLLPLAIHLWAKQQLSLVENIGVFLLFWAFSFLLMLLTSWLHTFTAVLKVDPPYRKYTLYALTDLRALIILAFPGAEPIVLAYALSEIEQPEIVLRPDGSGSVTFGAPRELKLYCPWLNFTLPGRFVGISDVPHVMELLLQLKEQDEDSFEEGNNERAPAD